MDKKLLLSFGAALVVGCGSKGDDGEGEGETIDAVLLYGPIIDAASGTAIADALVESGDLSATTNNSGFFSLSVSPSDSITLEISASGYVPAGDELSMPEAGTSYLEFSLLKYEVTTKIDAAAGGKVSTPDGASVTFPPDSLDAEGMVTVSIASLDPTDEGELESFPGDFTTSKGDLLESFGAISVDVRDASGNLVELAEGQSASAVVPVPVDSPDAIDQWVFNPETGKWEPEGDGWTGCSDGTCEGTLPSVRRDGARRAGAGATAWPTWWNCDLSMPSTCVEICTGVPGQQVFIESDTVAFNSRPSGVTGNDGCVCINVPNATGLRAEVVVSGGMTVETSFTSQDNLTARCGDSPSTCQRVDVAVTPPQAVAALTWTTDDDLDLHLTGPCPGCSDETPFHVFFAGRGSPNQSPFAELNTDDVDGPGPEIISLYACYPGTYRYSVNLFRGTDFGASHAQVRLARPGGVGELLSTDSDEAGLWILGDFTCPNSTSGGSCENCTWRTSDTYSSDTASFCASDTASLCAP